jgi:hypothetical protein
MDIRSGRVCSRCGADSYVRRTMEQYRYRQCLNPLCRLNWRTQEVMQAQMDDLKVWFERQAEECGPAMQRVMEGLGQMAGNLLGLIDALDYATEEVENDAAGERERLGWIGVGGPGSLGPG